MSGKLLSLILEGDVSLDDFANAVTHFRQLLAKLSYEVVGNIPIEWELQDLSYGSAHLTVIGQSENTQTVVGVVHAFERVGQALKNHQPIPYSSDVAKEAHALTKIIGEHVTAVRLGTETDEVILYGMGKMPSVKPLYSLGTVKGRVQSMSNRASLRFTLYDALFDKPITCFIQDDQQLDLTQYWDKWVYVTGRITRQPDTGQPIHIREVTQIEPVKEVVGGSYKNARGILAGLSDEPAEISIRRLRDAED
ncbi:MAG: hypothetical protein KJ043_12245 [Anaerolineae bacterium]|nr:hypothetical protein [Anaerolineae bacterium]